MKTKAIVIGLTALFVGGIVWADNASHENLLKWFKNGLYIGSQSKQPATVAANKITSSFGFSKAIDVEVVDGGSCLDTPVLASDAGVASVVGVAVGDPCFVGTPAAPTASTTFTCYVPATNRITLRACVTGDDNRDPASGTYYFRTFSSQ